jgi:hypothetical protein
MKVFLSYALRDRHVAERLTEGLQRAGLEVWAAEKEVLPGDNYGLQIGRALESADAMVVLVSPESMQSASVQSEINYALGASNFAGRLVPAIVRPTRAMPWIMERFPSVKVGADVEQAARKLVEILRHRFELQPA